MACDSHTVKNSRTGHNLLQTVPHFMTKISDLRMFYLKDTEHPLEAHFLILFTHLNGEDTVGLAPRELTRIEWYYSCVDRCPTLLSVKLLVQIIEIRFLECSLFHCV